MDLFLTLEMAAFFALLSKITVAMATGTLQWHARFE